MTPDDLTSSATRVLLALLFAVAFAMTFLLQYSPERLLAQILLGALVLDGLRPFLMKLNAGMIRPVSAIAYFGPRVFFFSLVCSWFLNSLPPLLSKALSHTGWELGFQVVFALWILVIMVGCVLTLLFQIAHPVWADTFGRKPLAPPT